MFQPVFVSGPVARDRFRDEIRALNRPVVLKGQVAGWPAVTAARQSSEAAGQYLKQFDLGLKTPVSICAAAERGRFFYTDDVAALNYRTIQHFLPDIIDRLLRDEDRTDADSYYMQSLPVANFLPRFAEHNRLDLVDADVAPRIWIGNRLQTQTHFDQLYNVACVVAGRRRFVLFPPDQVGNLYPGPDDLTPGGTPVSMVDLDRPDLELYPRFAEALKVAQVAELESGDAIYIPYAWWHNVRSLDGFNILVNYWWNEADPALLSAGLAFKAALAAFRNMPDDQNRAWKSLFDYYVFRQDGDPVAHLPAGARGSLGEPDAAWLARMKAQLKAGLG
jgi:hypothetical protein